MTGITLTLGDIRAAGPCADGWTKLLRAVGQDHAAPDLSLVVGLGDILISNGLADTRWCFRCLSPRDRGRVVMPAVKRAAERTTDQRVHDCNAAIERWLDGDDSVDLWAARAAARAAASAAAAWAAAWAATAAAWAATAAAWAATAAAWAAEAAVEAAAWVGGEGRDAELAAQRADIMRLSPPLILKAEEVA